jgi:hypothetical protein
LLQQKAAASLVSRGIAAPGAAAAAELWRLAAQEAPMVQDSDLRLLSKNGRYAYALACIERLCGAWGVDDPFVQGEVAAHWRALEAKWPCEWLEEHLLPRDVAAFAARVGGPLSADQVQSLHHALDEARAVIGRSCYAAVSDTWSMQSVLNVVGILARWGIEPPPVAGFRHANWSGAFDHGQRFTRASFVF